MFERIIKVEDPKVLSKPLRLTSSLWLVLFAASVVGIAIKLEAKILLTALHSRHLLMESLHYAKILISTDLSDVEVFVYSRKNPTSPLSLLIDNRINNSTFLDPGKRTKLLIHGFSAGMYFARRFVDEYLHAGDYNILAVDWSKLASWDNYAASNSVIIGKYLGKVIAELCSVYGLEASKIHIIGHSLGSHVAAHIGRGIQQAGLGKIGRITALDPARPWFDGENRPLRINKNDADFVDVIHTNSGLMYEGCYSWSEPLGHIDFYPNGGVHQPGCTQVCLFDCINVSWLDLAGCSHDRAISFFISSINNSWKFQGRSCDKWEKYHSGKCNDEPLAYMGEAATPGLKPGPYFLKISYENNHPMQVIKMIH